MPPRTAEEVRTMMQDGSLRLRGVAAILQILAITGEEADPAALNLLADDVDREADAMSEAEVFLNHPPAVAAPRARLHTVEKDGA